MRSTGEFEEALGGEGAWGERRKGESNERRAGEEGGRGRKPWEGQGDNIPTQGPDRPAKTYQPYRLKNLEGRANFPLEAGPNDIVPQSTCSRTRCLSSPTVHRSKRANNPKGRGEDDPTFSGVRTT